MDGFTFGILVGVGVAAVIFFLMTLRPAPAIETPFGGKRVSFTTEVPADVAFRALAGPGNGLTVARSSEPMKRVILGDKIGLTSWGFWYPVDISSHANGTTEVSVGIRSKAVQWGPLVGRAQNKMLDRVRAVIDGAAA